MANIFHINCTYDLLDCTKDEISERVLSNLYRTYLVDQDGKEFNSEKLSFIDVIALAHEIKWQHESMIQVMNEECKHNRLTQSEYCDTFDEPDLTLHLEQCEDQQFSWHLHCGCCSYLDHSGYAGSTGFSPLEPRQRKPYADRIKGIIPNKVYMDIANDLLENALEDAAWR